MIDRLMKWYKSVTSSESVLAKAKSAAPTRPALPISSDESRGSSSIAQPEPRTRAFSTRDFSVEVVGESNYQPALKKARESVNDYGGTGYIKAILARQPSNQYDENAIVVLTETMDTLGYLKRDLARKYQPAFALWEGAGYLLHCQAKLFDGRGGRTNSIGAWLDLASPEDIASVFHNPKTRK